jgi:hypothetical protein
MTKPDISDNTGPATTTTTAAAVAAATSSDGTAAPPGNRSPRRAARAGEDHSHDGGCFWRLDDARWSCTEA